VVYMANYTMPVVWILFLFAGAEVRCWFVRAA
jgi:hypothetical protein